MHAQNQSADARSRPEMSKPMPISEAKNPNEPSRPAREMLPASAVNVGALATTRMKSSRRENPMNHNPSPNRIKADATAATDSR
jgi:hypothetical protein